MDNEFGKQFAKIFGIIAGVLNVYIKLIWIKIGSGTLGLMLTFFVNSVIAYVIGWIIGIVIALLIGYFIYRAEENESAAELDNVSKKRKSSKNMKRTK